MNKQKMVREIGRRTRLKNREVQTVVEALVDVWTEALANGERIELEGFMVMNVQTIEQTANRLLPERRFRKITVRASKALRDRLKEQT